MHNESIPHLERISSTLTDQLRETGGQMAEVPAVGRGKRHLPSQFLHDRGLRHHDEGGRGGDRTAARLGHQLSDKLLSVSGEFVQNVARARDDLYSYLEQASVGLTARLGHDDATVLADERAGRADVARARPNRKQGVRPARERYRQHYRPDRREHRHAVGSRRQAREFERRFRRPASRAPDGTCRSG